MQYIHAQELAVKLSHDLDSLQEGNERYASRNRHLQSQLHTLKIRQEQQMVDRGQLLKACLYTSPIFLLCGVFDAFVSTVILVPVLMEVVSYMDLGHGSRGMNDEDDDADDIGSSLLL